MRPMKVRESQIATSQRADTYTYMTSVKFAIESVLGKKAWYELKETESVKPWRKWGLKLITAYELALGSTVTVADEEWREDVAENLRSAKERLPKSETIEDVVACLCATLIRQSFLQIGFLPRYQGRDGPVLKSENWKLDVYRSVQYVQSEEQKASVFLSEQQRAIGHEQQFELKYQHRKSKSKLSFQKWCEELAKENLSAENESSVGEAKIEVH